MIVTENYNSTNIKEVNEQSYNISKLIIKTQLLEKNTNIIDYLELNKFEIIRVYRNAMLDKTNKRGTLNHALTENLATHDPRKQQQLENSNEATT